MKKEVLTIPNRDLLYSKISGILEKIDSTCNHLSSSFLIHRISRMIKNYDNIGFYQFISLGKELECGNKDDQ
jgi:hypothetical protein